MRARLREEGWRIVNDTPLPLVCFTHERIGGDPEAIQLLVDALQARGQVWVSRVLMPDGQAAIRASITSYESNGNDLQILLDELRACSATLGKAP
jgi:aromatic-L-amino-acid decarboxylase